MILKAIGTFLAIYAVLAIGSGFAGIVLDLGLGSDFHYSNSPVKIFRDGAALGIFMGWAASFMLTGIYLYLEI